MCGTLTRGPQIQTIVTVVANTNTPDVRVSSMLRLMSNARQERYSHSAVTVVVIASTHRSISSLRERSFYPGTLGTNVAVGDNSRLLACSGGAAIHRHYVVSSVGCISNNSFESRR